MNLALREKISSHIKASSKEELRGGVILLVLKLICLLMAIAYFAVFLYITISRINYPFALEWMEGTSYVQVYRILSGRLLYVEPSLDYVPLIYPPLYYYLSALIAKLIGLSFLPLRLVSLLSTLGCMGLIFLIVRKLQPSVFAQIIAIGLFSATFKIGGAWFDIARVDMLALFLALMSIFCLQFSKNSSYFLSGLLMALSCLTKQTFLILLVATSIYSFFLDRKRTWIVIISSLTIYAVSYMALNYVHAGWYKYFIYDLSTGHTEKLNIAGAGQLFLSLIFKPISLIFLFTVAYFIQITRERKSFSQMSILLIVGATLALSWLGIVNPGAFNNVIIPSYAILSIITGIFLAKNLSRNDLSKFLKAGILTLTMLQFFLLRYPIKDQIPTVDDLHAGQALLQEITAQPGDVYVPYHPEMMLSVGKRSYADWISMKELKGGFGDETGLKEWTKVKIQLRTAFRTGKFMMIIVDGANFLGSPEAYYQAKEIVYSDDHTFYPVTGWQTRPTIMYIPGN